MAGRPNVPVIAASIACAAVLEVFVYVSGFPLDFGIGADLAFLPALFAMFVFGFETALYITILTVATVVLLGANWFEGISRFIAVLPFLCVSGYQSLAAGGVRLNPLLLNMFLGFYAALLLFIAASPIVSYEVGNPFAPPSTLNPVTGTQSITLGFGDFLLGTVPIAFMLFFALFVFAYWLPHREDAGARIFSSFYVLGWMLLIALPIRAAATTAAYFYYTGPATTGLLPEQLLASTPALSVLAWSAAFGLIEVLIAWAAFAVVENMSGTMRVPAPEMPPLPVRHHAKFVPAPARKQVKPAKATKPAPKPRKKSRR